MKLKLTQKYDTIENELSVTLPDKSVLNDAFNQVKESCIETAENLYADYPEIVSQVKLELNAIEKSGRFPEIWVLKEIADYSHDEGYPVMPFGQENSLITFFLMGITSVDPKLYDYSTIPSRIFLALTEGFQNWNYTYTIAVSTTVLSKIENALNYKLRNIESGNETYVYKLIESDIMERIGRLSKETSVTYDKIDYLQQEVFERTFNEMFLHNFREADLTQRCCSFKDVVKQYAFMMCHSEQDKNYDLFLHVENYIFADDIVEALIDMGETDYAAASFAKIGNKKRKEELIQFLSQQKCPVYEFIVALKKLDYVWSKTTCIARVVPILMLRYYEIDYIKRVKKEKIS